MIIGDRFMAKRDDRRIPDYLRNNNLNLSFYEKKDLFRFFIMICFESSSHLRLMRRPVRRKATL